MQDPKAMQNILQLLGGSNADGIKQMESRARRGQFTFAATQYAVKSGCPCDACRFLVKAVDEELEEARKEAGIDAPGDDPLPRSRTPISSAQPAGDAGSGELPGGDPPPADDVSA